MSPASRLWRRAARTVETVGFAAAAAAYLLPFATYTGVRGLDHYSGLTLFFFGLALPLTFGAWPLGLAYFFAWSCPLLAAITALVYRRRQGWPRAAIGLVSGVVALGGFATAYSIGDLNPRQWGFFAGAAAFAVATVGGAMRLAVAIATREESEQPVREEPAESAQQELLRRSRRV